MSQSEHLAATIALSHADDVNGRNQDTRGAGPGVRLAAASVPALRDDTAAMLRRRLRVVASVLTFGLTLFLVRGFFLGDSLMQAIRFCVIAMTVGGVAATRRASRLSLSQLRIVELMVFGAVGVQLIAVQVTQTLAAAAESRTEAIVAVTMFSFVTWIFLVMTYGMFIPNNWRRALIFVVPASNVPTGLTLILGAMNGIVTSAVGIAALVGASLMSAVAAVCSLCGTHIVNSLRREAYEARQYGQYRLTKKLGSGGMGEVYLAEHRLLKRPSAIKLIHRGVDTDPAAIERFESEVQATATLSHWNTVEIFDYGHTEDGTFYYVMEYLPGLDLQQIVTQFGPMPPARVVHFLSQICAALEEAHSIGLIHRDIKPSNVIASRRGGIADVAKLVDFGLVQETKLDNTAAASFRVTGSPLFMSPEQANSPDSVDGRSDLYSLGITGYISLNRQIPRGRYQPYARAAGSCFAANRTAVEPRPSSCGCRVVDYALPGKRAVAPTSNGRRNAPGTHGLPRCERMVGRPRRRLVARTRQLMMLVNIQGLARRFVAT